jgi:hypothetical protein
VALLVTLAGTGVGCSSRNPPWATSINPCCGQDLIIQGIDPPVDRCADIVLDQETARRLMTDIASGEGMTHWHVRFIPGGPACIWEMSPGLSEEDYRHVRPPVGMEAAERQDAKADTARPRSRETAD